MNKRDALLRRLDAVGPGLRRRLEASEGHETFVQRFGGATLHQLGALRHLVRQGPLTMHELATRMEISPSSATQLVDRLVQHGLVERVPDPGDRRVNRVAVSAEAAAAVGDFERDRNRRLAALLAPLSDDELAAAVSIAERLASSEPVR